MYGACDSADGEDAIENVNIQVFLVAMQLAASKEYSYICKFSHTHIHDENIHFTVRSNNSTVCVS